MTTEYIPDTTTTDIASNSDAKNAHASYSKADLTAIPSILTVFPPEMLDWICQYVDPRSLRNLSLTCKYFYAHLRDNEWTWKHSVKNSTDLKHEWLFALPEYVSTWRHFVWRQCALDERLECLTASTEHVLHAVQILQPLEFVKKEKKSTHIIMDIQSHPRDPEVVFVLVNRDDTGYLQRIDARRTAPLGAALSQSNPHKRPSLLEKLTQDLLKNHEHTVLESGEIHEWELSSDGEALFTLNESFLTVLPLKTGVPSFRYAFGANGATKLAPTKNGLFAYVAEEAHYIEEQNFDVDFQFLHHISLPCSDQPQVGKHPINESCGSIFSSPDLDDQLYLSVRSDRLELVDDSQWDGLRMRPDATFDDEPWPHLPSKVVRILDTFDRETSAGRYFDSKNVYIDANLVCAMVNCYVDHLSRPLELRVYDTRTGQCMRCTNFAEHGIHLKRNFSRFNLMRYDEQKRRVIFGVNKGKQQQHHWYEYDIMADRWITYRVSKLCVAGAAGEVVSINPDEDHYWTISNVWRDRVFGWYFAKETREVVPWMAFVNGSQAKSRANSQTNVYFPFTPTPTNSFSYLDTTPSIP
jgi:hypothetical protein